MTTAIRSLLARCMTKESILSSSSSLGRRQTGAEFPQNVEVCLSQSGRAEPFVSRPSGEVQFAISEKQERPETVIM